MIFHSSKFKSGKNVSVLKESRDISYLGIL